MTDFTLCLVFLEHLKHSITFQVSHCSKPVTLFSKDICVFLKGLFYLVNHSTVSLTVPLGNLFCFVCVCVFLGAYFEQLS